jgi:hypothetical protein
MLGLTSHEKKNFSNSWWVDVYTCVLTYARGLLHMGRERDLGVYDFLIRAGIF